MKKLILFTACIFASFVFYSQDLTGFGIDGSKYLPQGIHLKSKAPYISGISGIGEKFDGRMELRDGPIVLTFIQGSWSEESQARVEFFKKHAAEFAEKNARVVIVSPEQAEKVQTLAEGDPDNLLIISDHQYQTMKGFDVLYHVLPEYQEELLSKNGVKLTSKGKGSAVLPVMATFVITKSGSVYGRHFDLDPSVLPNFEEIFAAIPKPRLDFHQKDK